MSADTSSVHVGKTIGYLLLGLVDALLPPVCIFCIGILVVPPELLETAFVHIVGVAVLSFVGAAVAGFIDGAGAIPRRSRRGYAPSL